MATILLTGASDGIGAAAAVELTQLGHAVVATGRSPAKLDAVHRRMVDGAPDDVVVPDAIAADLSSLAEVRRLADTVLERCPEIDVVANNAAVQTRRRATSPDGFELMLAVNHLAPFLLTNLLVDRLQAIGGRVVTTSSVAHRFSRIDFADLQTERGWRGFRAYGRSKLANIWFTSELTARTGVPATCFHPGAVNTELGRDTRYGTLLKPAMRVLRSPEGGADTLVWLATDPEGAAPRAVYYTNRKPSRTSAAARDTAAAARVWDASAELVRL